MNREEANPQRRRLTRAEGKARTREQLLDAAARTFAQKGFAGASVEEIAESAGYSTGALYANFESKEQLFLELLSARRSRKNARQAARVADILDAEAAGENLIEAFSRAFVRAARRNTQGAALQAEFWQYAVRHPEAMGIVAAKMDEQVDTLEPLAVLALERLGAAQEVSPRAVTRVMLSLFQGLGRQRRIDPDAVPDDLFIQALRWLFAGLQSVTTPPPVTVDPPAPG